LNQDKPETITVEVGHFHKTAEVYSANHYYQHEAQICQIFGCGKELSLVEKLSGTCCKAHQGAVIEKASPAMLIRMQEVIADMGLGSENRHNGCTQSESQSH